MLDGVARNVCMFIRPAARRATSNHRPRSARPLAPRVGLCLGATRFCVGQQQRQNRLGETARRCDGVKCFAQAFEGAIIHEQFLIQFIAHDDGRRYGKACARARQQTQHRHIVDFCDDVRTEAQAHHERVEFSPDMIVRRGNDQGLLRQEALQRAARRRPAWADQADGLVVDDVRRPGRLIVPRRQRIREQDVNLMRSSIVINSRMDPERSTIRTSVRESSGCKNAIWKLRDSVEVAPSRTIRRPAASSPFKVRSNSSPVSKIASARSKVTRPASVSTNWRPCRSNKACPS